MCKSVKLVTIQELMTPTFIALAASVAAATVIVILLIGESGDGVRREVQYTETVYGIRVRCDVILIHYFLQ